ncbi:MAG: hypothetical protein ABR543_07810 [Gemmatimonadaceae bacterium]
MSLADYLKRIAIMSLVAMPCTVLMFTLVQMRDESARAEGVVNTLGAATFLVYIWGIVTGILLSLAHTYIADSLARGSMVMSVIAAVLLGLAAGAVTPTAFTGFLNPHAILWGGFTGLIYAAIVSRLFS